VTARGGRKDYFWDALSRGFQQEMDQDELNQKLDQIEEQAQLTLAEFPKTLTKERQRMIIALVRYIRAECQRGVALPQAEESAARLRSV